IYLTEAPTTDDALNTVIHELSHASRSDSADYQRLMALQELMNEDNPELTPRAELHQRLDYYLLLAREERDGEVDGHLGELVGQVDEQGGEANAGQRAAADAWETREPGEDSSTGAKRQWDFHRYEAAEQGYVTDDYKALGEAYLLRQGPFPEASAHAPAE
ncbi:MAG: hypothetical protein QF464_15835, partial [Myxococcota bacterium]|nr:hypothetical protein [Myxococcota bacterium]